MRSSRVNGQYEDAFSDSLVPEVPAVFAMHV